MAGWWAGQLNPEGLSQGDVISELLIGAAAPGPVYLRKRTFSQHAQGWEQGGWNPDNSGLGFYLGRGRRVRGLVVSHSCEISNDQNKRRARVLVAPLAAVDALPEGHWEDVLKQEHKALLALTDVPGLGNLYADFRLISYVERELIDKHSQRVLSMTPEGVCALWAKLLLFFIRKTLPDADFLKLEDVP